MLTIRAEQLRLLDTQMRRRHGLRMARELSLDYPVFLALRVF
jgi:hypothetical protein